MLKEFREFALRGNVVDLAIGVIIGAAFGRIVESIVADIFMPIIAAITGSIDFSNLYFMLTGTAAEGTSLAEARKVGAVFAYGNFITVTVNFIIIAFVLFLVVKAINQVKRSAPPPPPAAPAPEVALLSEIRDLLKK